MNSGKLIYTVYGDVSFDNKIDKDMKLIAEKILSAVPQKSIAAIILGGGYGRGEGGVAIENGKMELYNDYDMFIVSNGLSYGQKQEYRKIIHKASEELTHEIGVDVDFPPLVNKSDLPNMPFTLMYYELKNGHKVIYGEKDILSHLPEFDIDNIPKEEHLNLMLNRGTGLILAAGKLAKKEKTKEDNMFVERNIFKALMACGDVFLMSKKNYSYSYVKRFELIEQFKEDPILKENNFIEYYKMSLMYKLKPENNFALNEERYAYAVQAHRKMFLYIFGRYYDRELRDFADFYENLFIRGVGSIKSLKSLVKNILLNLKEIGTSNFSTKFFVSYPRLRLFYSMPYFLYGEKLPGKVPLVKVLGASNGQDTDSLRQKYLKIWGRFN